MKLYYDLHIHSALSPCADNDMTPNNIVGMSIIKKLDVIAVTDHNSIGNCNAIIKAAEDTALIVVPGMELQTTEDIHVLCLFKDMDSAKEFDQIVQEKMMKIKLDEKLFGEEILYNEKDEETGRLDYLLLVSANLSLDETIDMVDRVGGFAIPAHVHRRQNSILSNLSFVPKNQKLTALELYNPSDRELVFEKNNEMKFYDYVYNSDAHRLGFISERKNYIDVNERTAESVINALKTGEGIL